MPWALQMVAVRVESSCSITKSFDVLGRFDVDRGPQYLAYDFRWYLGYDVAVTSEWGTPNMIENGLNLELLTAGKYGHAIHIWDLRRRRVIQSLDLGAEHQMALELRPAHDPTQAYGFIWVVVSTKDLSASIWTWYRDNGTWSIRKVVEIPAEPADPVRLPPALRSFKAVPPLITLEETHPTPPLFPADPNERARMRLIEDLCDRTFDAVAYGYWVAVMRTEAPEAEAMKTAAKIEFEALLGVLERELGGRDFLRGALSVADLTAVCYMPSALAMGIELHQFPALVAWLERMGALPMVRTDMERFSKAMAEVHDITSELEGPDGRVQWRDSRLEWPIRKGFVDFVTRELSAGRMMFPPDAARAITLAGTELFGLDKASVGPETESSARIRHCDEQE